jgi:hypothetical protein
MERIFRCGLNITFSFPRFDPYYASVIPVMVGDRPVDKLRLGWEPQEELPTSRPKPAMFRLCSSPVCEAPRNGRLCTKLSHTNCSGDQAATLATPSLGN